MTVGDYINELRTVIDSANLLCPLNNLEATCARCPLHKAEGKACPIQQLEDMQYILQYAVLHGVHGITSMTSVSDPMVILYVKRAVTKGNSVYTLRPCNDDYIKLRNLLEVPTND